MEEINLAELDTNMKTVLRYVRYFIRLRSPPRNIPAQVPIMNIPADNDLSLFEAHPECQPPNTNPSIFFSYDFIRNTYNQLK